MPRKFVNFCKKTGNGVLYTSVAIFFALYRLFLLFRKFFKILIINETNNFLYLSDFL